MSNQQRFFAGQVFTVGTQANRYKYSKSELNNQGLILVETSFFEKTFMFYGMISMQGSQGFILQMTVLNLTPIKEYIRYSQLSFEEGGAHK